MKGYLAGTGYYIFDGIFLGVGSTGMVWTTVLWYQDTFQLATKYCLADSGVWTWAHLTLTTIASRTNSTNHRTKNAIDLRTKSKSEWRAIWDGGGLNTRDCREWRDVYTSILRKTVHWHQDTFQLYTCIFGISLQESNKFFQEGVLSKALPTRWFTFFLYAQGNLANVGLCCGQVPVLRAGRAFHFPEYHTRLVSNRNGYV